MIELTDHQRQALDGPEQPVRVIDPRTGQEFLLIKREVYDVVCGIVRPYNRNWDPDDDLVRDDV